jgi:hypothetical protein
MLKSVLGKEADGRFPRPMVVAIVCIRLVEKCSRLTRKGWSPLI